MSYQGLIEEFRNMYGDSPGITVIRSPGRVNLIGEHTDYNGLPVFPMAVERAVTLVVALREDRKIVINNVLAEYPARSFEIGGTIKPYPVGDWGNYAKAAVQGIYTHLQGKSSSGKSLHGMNVLVRGNIPIACGLSSSTALVVGFAWAFLHVNNCRLDRKELAELLARAEKYVGTEGGGMDQAVCLLGQRDYAIKIDFFPLRARRVPLPSGCRMIVCQSMVKACKAGEAREAFNRRAIECRLANLLVSNHLEQLGQFKRIGDLVKANQGIPLEDIAAQVLGQDSWTLEQIACVLGWEENKLRKDFLRLSDGSIFQEPADGFKLLPRFRHVITESERVEAAVESLERGDLETFGRLMNESHRSCRDDYEISCVELDKLVSIALENGALGARLTGAGFGGCTVSLVREEHAEAVKAGIADEYFDMYLRLKRPDVYGRLQEYDDVIFSCSPEDGVGIVELENSSTNGVAV